MQATLRQLLGLVPHSGADRSRVLREQTDLLIRQTRTGFLVAMIGGALLGVPMLLSIGPLTYFGWLGLLVVGYTLRQRLMERAQASGSLEQVLVITLVGSALIGLVITAPGPVFFPHVSADWRAFMTMVYLVWLATAVSVLGVFPPSYKVYLVGAMFNVALGWWLAADTLPAALVSAFLLPMWFVLTRVSDRVGRLMEESINIRHERELLVGRLQESLAETEAAQKARSRFLASASHDLLQPVHALLLLASLSRDLPEGPRREDVLKQLHTTAEAIDSMFRGLLDLARFDAGTLQPQLTTMPVAHVLRAVQAAYQARCADKGVLLTVATPPGIYVHADPAMFDRIVRNLVDNAVKFTPRGEIAVRCTSIDGLVTIEVQDSGVGIAEADLGHVQEAFYRGGSAREVDADGVGLGLANSTQMARLLHGDIHLDSVHGKGTSVRFTLPAGDNPITVAPGLAHRKELRFRRLVLVEDDRAARVATELWLQERGATVVAGADLQSVLAQCEARGLVPEYLLCDFKLGDGANGVQTIAALRERFGPLPAALISGEQFAAGELPADIPLLAKPLRPERLEQLLT